MESTLKVIYVYVRLQCSFTVDHMRVLNDQDLLLLNGGLRHAVPRGVPWGEHSPFRKRIS